MKIKIVVIILSLLLKKEKKKTHITNTQYTNKINRILVSVKIGVFSRTFKKLHELI